MTYITKTIYLEFLACAKNAWLKQHKPELMATFSLSPFEQSLVANGNLVEGWARKMFPGGVLVESFGAEAILETEKLLTLKTPVIFQATFAFGHFLARNDVLEYDQKNDVWNLYEIKGTNTLRESGEERDHLEDAAFQYVVLRDCGLKIGRVGIIHLNKDYVRGDEINVFELFVTDDVTDKILEREAATREKMQQIATAFFQDNERALSCDCLYKGRSKNCSTFHYSHPQVPEYSVHDLARIGSSKSKLNDLIEAGIYDLNDIPQEFELTKIQRNQVDVHQNQKPIIDREAIKESLESATYPLYFLDYETYPSAIPLFKGYRPYQHIPFQFSLHVLDSPNGTLKHYEYLHSDNSNPGPVLTAALKEIIGPQGSIIVWNKAFEKSRNTEMAERQPEEKDFLLDVNNRVYDLMDIFHKQLYVHPDFKGRVSIKKILPVLVPALSYQALNIREGGAAMEAWFGKVLNATSNDEKEATIKALLEYCALDTYAMYAIWQELVKLL